MLLSTHRLDVRELTHADLPALKAILQDAQTMTAYEGPFSDHEVEEWLSRILNSYHLHGFGLWAVTLRSTGTMIGQCGITIQNIMDTDVPEVGYLFNREHWHQGFAIESAAACRDFAFDALNVERLWCQVRDTNIASMNVAIRLGMTVRGRFIKEYRGASMPHYAFSMDRPAPVAAGE